MVKLRFQNSDEDKRDRALVEALRKHGRIDEIFINTEKGSIEAGISVDEIDAFILIDELKRNLVSEIEDHPIRKYKLRPVAGQSACRDAERNDSMRMAKTKTAVPARDIF